MTKTLAKNKPIDSELVETVEVEDVNTPKTAKLKKLSDLFIYACPKTIEDGPDKGEKCGGIHYRHAGYVEVCLPFKRGASEDANFAHTSPAVKVCIKCKGRKVNTAYIFHDKTMYDVSEKVDLDAWEAVEPSLNQATGDGGEC